MVPTCNDFCSEDYLDRYFSDELVLSGHYRVLRTESDKGSGNTTSQSHFTPSYQCHQTPLALMQCTKQLLGVPKLLMHQSVLGVQCQQQCKSHRLGHWSPLWCS